MKKRAVLSAGGTGGHLFPAQSLAEALPDWEILFVAGGLSTNSYFNREKYPFEEVSSATFAWRNPLQVLKGSKQIASGVLQSRKILERFNPDVVVGFGSFFTLPVLAAAVLARKPIVLHEQNAIPGKVNRLFAPFARKVTITFPSTREWLKKDAVEVIFPQKKKGEVSSQEAWDYFGLKPCERPVILVFGGSQGAARLNTLFLEALAQLPPVQVLHFTGTEERAALARDHYRALSIPACVKPFEPRMELAMKIADCAVTRAGAATVCELIDATLPALLIPYPFATENHQEKNGAHFVSLVKGGKMYKENGLDATLLAATVSHLLDTRSAYRKEIAAYKEQRRAIHLANLIEDLIA